MRRRSEELTEIGRLFRGKLRELREAERRNQRGRGKRSRVARGRARSKRSNHLRVMRLSSRQPRWRNC